MWGGGEVGTWRVLVECSEYGELEKIPKILTLFIPDTDPPGPIF